MTILNPCCGGVYGQEVSCGGNYGVDGNSGVRSWLDWWRNGSGGDVGSRNSGGVEISGEARVEVAGSVVGVTVVVV